MTGDRGEEAGDLLRRGLERLGIGAGDETVARLVRYCVELEKWNRKINLIARNTRLEDIVDKHFLDSLTLVPILDRLARANSSLLDVGSGAGFPGLVLKIVRPDLSVVLLEPRERRGAFLRHVIRQTGLKDIEVAAARVEEKRIAAGKYAVITGRAVADVATFLGMVAPLAGPETLVICMQGGGGRGDWRKGDRVGGFACVGVEETMLPFSRAKRFMLLFRKPE
ncbi:MAG TPA: 16S rRNA (guanine(527)-N(7))-methyltransferase RsmG [Desulfobacteraceae bacterium]|nr:16S rRNA (guanine(527)-N(7))-methyltransferase RsmG [Desulfobacteraceae bacterium]